MNTKYFVADFETTVFDNQEYTEVWASACAELFTNNVKVFHSIREQYDYFVSLKTNIVVYYHNLKFDGMFWLSFLLVDLNFKQAFEETTQGYQQITNKDMPRFSVKYTISDKMGMWYSLTIKTTKYIIELRDSLKLLPFSVKDIGIGFQTEHQKLEMEYKGFRYAGCDISKDEMEYIKNDVLVMKEAMELMLAEGHNKMTIGSCCLSEFKRTIEKTDYDLFFPDLTQYKIDKIKYGEETAEQWIRKAYKGGWCYLVDGKENKVFENGLTLDVNSLYPSMMSSQSGNRYPIGLPSFWCGNYIPKEAIMNERYFFIRIKTRFEIKDGFLPFIQIKGDKRYKGTECLKTSDVVVNKEKYHASYDETGELKQARVSLTLTCTDYKLFREHYNVSEFEILGGCWFYTEIGLFDEYINKYKEIKMSSSGARRVLAKLYLNNLYGKMATSDDSSFKIAYVKDDKTLGFTGVEAHEKEVGYIPIGSAITSYARNFTIRAAQKNYYGSGKAGFIYADTDSIHCDLPPNEIKGVPIDDVDFCHWKLESFWDKAIFVRQKTYIEHIVAETKKGARIDINPEYDIKCAGMPKNCKNLLRMSLENTHKPIEECTNDEKSFLYDKDSPIERTLADFKSGLEVPCKLVPTKIRGGIVLTNTTFKISEV